MGSTTSPSTQKPPQHPWRRTPLHESPTLSRSAECRIFLKLENLQPSSSFKSRGIGNFILSAIKAAPSNTATKPNLHFFISSGGNAGLAAVAACNTLQYPCSVALPTSATPAIIAKLRAAGAHEVLVHGDSWADADRFLRETVIPNAERASDTNPGEGKEGGKVKGVYVPPFDHPDVWAGHATLVAELAEQLAQLDTEDSAAPDAIVCSVGGGGLFSGIMQGVAAQGWENKTKVLALETEGAESLHASLQKGELVTLPGITSVAASLGAVRVAQRAYEQAQRPNVVSEVLSDAEACMGCWRFADDERMLVEPACGVSVALAYQPERLRRLLPGLGRESRVVIVVCGGSRVDLDTLQGWREEYGPVIEKMGLGGKGVGRGDVSSTFTSE